MSLILKDPTSNNAITEFLFNANKRHSDLPVGQQFFKLQTKNDLAAKATEFPLKVNAANFSEGTKINNNSILNLAYLRLQKNNACYLKGINNMIDDEVLPPSVRLFFGMDSSSDRLPSMTTHADIFKVSQNIEWGDAELVNRSYPNPQDVPASKNLLLRNDVNDKITIYRASEDAWTANVHTLAVCKAFCLELAVTVRKEIQFHVTGQTEEQVRDYCRSFGVVYEPKKDTTEIDVLALFADGSGIALGTTARIGKLVISRNKVKKIEAVQGVTKTVNAHGEAILNTTQTGDLFVIYTCPGCEDGHVPITIVEGEDQSITIHLVKKQPE
ncbi:MAG: hypothetical protein WCH34_07670 [Bacteroidota bacterium]